MTTLTDTLRVRTSLARHLKQAGTSDDERVKELIAGAALLLLGLTQKLSAGSITRRGFLFQAMAVLSGHMQQAAALAVGAEPGDDPNAIDELLLSKSTYLEGFAADIASGAISEAQAAARANLWAGLSWSAFQTGKGMAAGAEARRTGATVSITWDCDGDERSCADCTSLAAGSPYTPDSLPTVPGSDVQCNGACRCSLRYELGSAGDGGDEGGGMMAKRAIAKPQTVVPYQALTFTGGDWRLVTVKWQRVRRPHAAPTGPAPIGWVGRWDGAASGRETVLTLRHCPTGQDITATFAWDGEQWICPDRGLSVSAATMWAGIARGFGRAP